MTPKRGDICISRANGARFVVVAVDDNIVTLRAWSGDIVRSLNRFDECFELLTANEGKTK